MSGLEIEIRNQKLVDKCLRRPDNCKTRHFTFVKRTRTAAKCRKMKSARAKRAKVLFFIVKYANL